MKKALLSLVAVAAGVTTTLCVTASRYQETVQPETFLGPLNVGGLTVPEAQKRVRVWWENERTHVVDVAIPDIHQTLPSRSLSELGAYVDDQASVQQLPLVNFAGSAAALIRPDDGTTHHFKIVFGVRPDAVKSLAAEVSAVIEKPSPAAIHFEDGEVVRTYEVAARALDPDSTAEAIKDAARDETSLDLPLKSLPKKVRDEDLDQIQDVVSTFTTRFPASNRPRCSNIKLAAGRLNGVILMPGERLSFNDQVGRRTLRKGFLLAGVYKNGKHDTGVGGGICQVSTTLYNAALLGDLRIRRRSNHSLPVAYVPLGRDATVDYGNLDLVVENSYPTPIAVVSTYEPGRLTFRILGKKDPTLNVKITTRVGTLIPKPLVVKTVPDPHLSVGKKKILERGSVMHSVFTYRLIYRDGQLERKEALGRSYYGGSDRVVAVGTKPKRGISVITRPMAGAMPVSRPVSRPLP